MFRVKRQSIKVSSSFDLGELFDINDDINVMGKELIDHYHRNGRGEFYHFQSHDTYTYTYVKALGYQ